MGTTPRSPFDNLKHTPLWQWGLYCIIGGVGANFVLSTMQPLKGITTAAERGFAFGRGLATFLFVIAGVILIVLHFIKRRPGSRTKTPKRKRKPS